MISALYPQILLPENVAGKTCLIAAISSHTLHIL